MKDFKNEWWDLIKERFDAIDKKQDALAEDLSEIKQKLKYVWGFVAGVSLTFNALWFFIKDRFFKN